MKTGDKPQTTLTVHLPQDLYDYLGLMAEEEQRSVQQMAALCIQAVVRRWMAGAEAPRVGPREDGPTLAA